VNVCGSKVSKLAYEEPMDTCTKRTDDSASLSLSVTVQEVPLEYKG